MQSLLKLACPTFSTGRSVCSNLTVKSEMLTNAILWCTIITSGCSALILVLWYSIVSPSKPKTRSNLSFWKQIKDKQSLKTTDIFLLYCLYSTCRTFKIIIQTNLKLQKWCSIHSISFVIWTELLLVLTLPALLAVNTLFSNYPLLVTLFPFFFFFLLFLIPACFILEFLAF